MSLYMYYATIHVKCEVSLQAHTFIIIKLIPCVVSFSSQKTEREIQFSRNFVSRMSPPSRPEQDAIKGSILGLREAEKVIYVFSVDYTSAYFGQL